MAVHDLKGDGIQIVIKIIPVMPMKIFLLEINEDKYRNEIIIKFWIFLVFHVVKSSPEDWPTYLLLSWAETNIHI